VFLINREESTIWNLLSASKNVQNLMSKLIQDMDSNKLGRLYNGFPRSRNLTKLSCIKEKGDFFHIHLQKLAVMLFATVFFQPFINSEVHPICHNRKFKLTFCGPRSSPTHNNSKPFPFRKLVSPSPVKLNLPALSSFRHSRL